MYINIERVPSLCTLSFYIKEEFGIGQYKANPSPPAHPPTSIGHMPGLWGGYMGCLMGQLDIIQIQP